MTRSEERSYFEKLHADISYMGWLGATMRRHPERNMHTAAYWCRYVRGDTVKLRAAS